MEVMLLSGMIREDTSDGVEGKRVEDEEEQVEASPSRRQSNIPYPQISITDTQGQVRDRSEFLVGGGRGVALEPMREHGS